MKLMQLSDKILSLLIIIAVIACFYSAQLGIRLKADPDNAGLTLPGGFGALKIADLGAQARHISVTPQGLIYFKLAK